MQCNMKGSMHTKETKWIKEKRGNVHSIAVNISNRVLRDCKYLVGLDVHLLLTQIYC